MVDWMLDLMRELIQDPIREEVTGLLRKAERVRRSALRGDAGCRNGYLRQDAHGFSLLDVVHGCEWTGGQDSGCLPPLVWRCSG